MIPAVIPIDTGLVVALVLWGLSVTVLVAGITVAELRWAHLSPRLFRHVGRIVVPWVGGRRHGAVVRPLVIHARLQRLPQRRMRSVRAPRWGARVRPYHLRVVR